MNNINLKTILLNVQPNGAMAKSAKFIQVCVNAAPTLVRRVRRVRRVRVGEGGEGGTYYPIKNG